MKKTALLTLAACAILLTATGASAAKRTAVQSCAIIHAVYLAKKAQREDKAAATFCRRYVPGKMNKDGSDANATLKTKLATSVSRRHNSLGTSSNNKVGKLKDADGNVVGSAGCDPDVQGQLPKRTDFTVAEIEAVLDQALGFCDERF